MAAERVFYDENSSGVAAETSSRSPPGRVDGRPRRWACSRSSSPRRRETEEQARERILERFEGIGLQIMSRTCGNMMSGDPISGILSDPSKRKVTAQMLGQAYVVAHNLVLLNRDGVEKIANAVLERKELFGDELVDLLDSVGLRLPEIDYADESPGRRRSSPSAPVDADHPQPHRS